MSPVRRRHVVLRKMVSDEIRRRLPRGLIAVISRNAGILPLSRPVQFRPLWIHSLDLNTTDRKNPSDLDDDSMPYYWRNAAIRSGYTVSDKSEIFVWKSWILIFLLYRQSVKEKNIL